METWHSGTLINVLVTVCSCDAWGTLAHVGSYHILQVKKKDISMMFWRNKHQKKVNIRRRSVANWCLVHCLHLVHNILYYKWLWKRRPSLLAVYYIQSLYNVHLSQYICTTYTHMTNSSHTWTRSTLIVVKITLVSKVTRTTITVEAIY